jgi:hypothetical protein
MKTFLFLLSILATTLSYSQDAIHILFTTEGKQQITEPLCEGMLDEAERLMQKEMKNIREAQKNSEFKSKDLNLEKQAKLNSFIKLAENPQDYFPIYVPLTRISKAYRNLENVRICASLQEISLKELGAANIEVALRNLVVSPSTTSIDLDIIDLSKPGAPKQTKHFSCATGRILEEQQEEAQWFFFWQRFYDEVNMEEWLNEELYKLNKNLVSEKQFNQLIETKLATLGMATDRYVQERVDQLKQKVIGLPLDFSIAEIKGILANQTQTKFVIYTQEEDDYYIPDVENPEDYPSIQTHSVQTWGLQFNTNGEVLLSLENERTVPTEALTNFKNNFYASALSPLPELAYSDDRWMAFFFEDNGQQRDNSKSTLRRESQSKTSTQLIQTYIQPLLNQLLQNDSSQYNNFYQRLTPEDLNDYYMQYEEPIILKDYLLSNPEQTIFIYPVLLNNRTDPERSFYYTNEDFRFYVLMKNETGTFDVYDWHYFSALPYKEYYSLLTCAHSHLNKISNWDGEADVIQDDYFWKNFILKKSERGFDFLTLMTDNDQSPTVTQAEFDAQVSDCIKLIKEQDIADCYTNQVKQIILCLNTINTYNLKGKEYDVLTTWARELNFQKRLNKVQKFDGHYYPMLHLEFGGNLQAHSYYQLK